jgi:hypothetical protein
MPPETEDSQPKIDRRDFLKKTSTAVALVGSAMVAGKFGLEILKQEDRHSNEESLFEILENLKEAKNTDWEAYQNQTLGLVKEVFRTESLPPQIQQIEISIKSPRSDEETLTLNTDGITMSRLESTYYLDNGIPNTTESKQPSSIQSTDQFINLLDDLSEPNSSIEVRILFKSNTIPANLLANHLPSNLNIDPNGQFQLTGKNNEFPSTSITFTNKGNNETTKRTRHEFRYSQPPMIVNLIYNQKIERDENKKNETSTDGSRIWFSNGNSSRGEIGQGIEAENLQEATLQEIKNN